MSAILKSPKNQNNRDLTVLLSSLDVECRNCTPITPFECIKRCQVYKIKNELRQSRKIMNDPNYIKKLFNTLKNETRIHILKAIANGRCSISQLQQELNKDNHKPSQDTLSKEYLNPLMAVALATRTRDEYCATNFGGRLLQLLGPFSEFAKKLPAHSECYEEALLQSLLSGPRTFKDIESLIPPKIASRILNRLRVAGLVQTSDKRDYIFFFKSKRDPRKETFASNEQKIYDLIPDKGISAGKLSKETSLSIRRTYMSLRGLKGKKLIFIRKTPRAYNLTIEGRKLALMLQELQKIVGDTLKSSEKVIQDSIVA